MEWLVGLTADGRLSEIGISARPASRREPAMTVEVAWKREDNGLVIAARLRQLAEMIELREGKLIDIREGK